MTLECGSSSDGQTARSTQYHGALLKGAARHPIIEDDVVIHAGATILGRVTIRVDLQLFETTEYLFDHVHLNSKSFLEKKLFS
jgi:hypothetical protein